MEKYRLEIKKSAVKEIQRLSRKGTLVILEKIGTLTHNPRPHDCKKMSSQERYRIRCGVYRILYEIQDKVLIVYIVKVGHRKDVYKG